jgi:hypothetical protein
MKGPLTPVQARHPRCFARVGHIGDASIASVHNYEHGGSGVTLACGCAAKVTNLVAMAWRSARTTLPREPLTA